MLKKATFDVHDVANVLRQLKQRRELEINEMTVCITGRYAHCGTTVSELHQDLGHVVVSFCKGAPVEQVPLVDVFHFMDYFEACHALYDAKRLTPSEKN